MLFALDSSWTNRWERQRAITYAHIRLRRIPRCHSKKLTWCSARNSRMSTTCHAGEKTPAIVRPSPARMKTMQSARSAFCAAVLVIRMWSTPPPTPSSSSFQNLVQILQSSMKLYKRYSSYFYNWFFSTIGGRGEQRTVKLCRAKLQSKKTAWPLWNETKDWGVSSDIRKLKIARTSADMLRYIRCLSPISQRKCRVFLLTPPKEGKIGNQQKTASIGCALCQFVGKFWQNSLS